MMTRKTSVRGTALAALSLGLAVFGVVPEAWAVACEASIREIRLPTRGEFEGSLNIKLRLNGESSDRVWVLCSLNEQDANPAFSKNGTELSAVHEGYAVTCEAVLNLVTVAHATGKTVKLDFSDSVFPTCGDVTQWGGLANGDSDDLYGRLGAWDGLNAVTITSNDSIFQ